MEKISDKIREYLDRGGSAVMLSRACDVTPAAVYSWLNGTCPSARYLPALSRALGVSVEDLLNVE